MSVMGILRQLTLFGPRTHSTAVMFLLVRLCSQLNSVWVLENGTIPQNTPRMGEDGESQRLCDKNVCLERRLPSGSV